MSYFTYFFYLAFNWNIRLACFVIYHEIKGEKKYHQKTIGVDNLKKEMSKENLAHASVYQPINYYSAEQLFEQIFYEDLQGSLLDVGCGKGRIFGIAAAYGFTQIIGVDFSQKLCTIAQKNASTIMADHPAICIQVVFANAAVFSIPPSVGTLFLFNPFDASMMRLLLGNLKLSLQQNPRPFKVLYANPVCKNLFVEMGFVETFYFKKLTYLEGCVLELA